MTTDQSGVTNIDMSGHLKLSVNKSIKKQKVVRRRSNVKREIPICLALQELYSCCRNVFKEKGFVPPPEDVQSLCNILDRMGPEDVGLSKNLQFFNPGNSTGENPRVAYTTMYRCKDFSMVLFFLPAAAVIPLHNHPEMTVFSKLLFGKMHIKSYDLADPIKAQSSNPSSHMRLARLVTNKMYIAPCDTSVLYPTTGGNIHTFTAITPCVVLDVLGPPYSKEDDRDCTYYRDFPYSVAKDGPLIRASEHDNEEYGWLEEIEMPEESKMEGIRYMGPPILEDLW